MNSFAISLPSQTCKTLSEYATFSPQIKCKNLKIHMLRYILLGLCFDEMIPGHPHPNPIWFHAAWINWWPGDTAQKKAGFLGGHSKGGSNAGQWRIPVQTKTVETIQRHLSFENRTHSSPSPESGWLNKHISQMKKHRPAFWGEVLGSILNTTDKIKNTIKKRKENTPVPTYKSWDPSAPDPKAQMAAPDSIREV